MLLLHLNHPLEPLSKITQQIFVFFFSLGERESGRRRTRGLFTPSTNCDDSVDFILGFSPASICEWEVNYLCRFSLRKSFSCGIEKRFENFFYCDSHWMRFLWKEFLQGFAIQTAFIHLSFMRCSSRFRLQSRNHKIRKTFNGSSQHRTLFSRTCLWCKMIRRCERLERFIS